MGHSPAFHSPAEQRQAPFHFLFLGCRFRTQLERAYARRIMKRSPGLH